MTSKQLKAVERLRKALDACDAAGLTGGVFDCSMYVWPSDTKTDPRDYGRQFFEVANQVGVHIYSTMVLDGGAGA